MGGSETSGREFFAKSAPGGYEEAQPPITKTTAVNPPAAKSNLGRMFRRRALRDSC